MDTVKVQMYLVIDINEAIAYLNLESCIASGKNDFFITQEIMSIHNNSEILNLYSVDGNI